MSDIYIENEPNAAWQYVVLRSREHVQIVWNMFESLGFEFSTVDKESMTERDERWTAIRTDEVEPFVNCLETVGISYEIINTSNDIGLYSFLEVCGITGEHFND